MSDLTQLLDYVRLTNEYRSVERTIYAPGSPRFENDIEHASQLALVAWYLNTRHDLGLSLERLLTYALAHDVVEVYAGDVFVYDTDAAKHAAKDTREQEAMRTLEKRFPHFPALHEALDAYHKRSDRESAFVYALDKLLPILNNYLDGGRIWKEYGITLEQVVEIKRTKIRDIEPVRAYTEALIARLEREHAALFSA